MEEGRPGMWRVNWILRAVSGAPLGFSLLGWDGMVYTWLSDIKQKLAVGEVFLPSS